ncbi:glutaredoxin family protein [Pseudanabaena sp. FACHB-2040]|uniref:glutaredoxin family protein n=1 Tax=Pseudanabaena sp. FACHB-2040 TaxID=2692859 RepID=UPI0016870FD6|nr:glutaredoxin family protein [Pseudanabaena sp. FACHB-2040]MBD2258930.1 glutaredoxin family protein [Pseudanabaena sp. FACHB-2040]
MQLVLYSKPGCHLCEGLQEKLTALAHLPFNLEIRDITTREDWFGAYQYEIPVLCQVVETAGGRQEKPLPRLSPRASLAQVERLIQTCLYPSEAE